MKNLLISLFFVTIISIFCILLLRIFILFSNNYISFFTKYIVEIKDIQTNKKDLDFFVFYNDLDNDGNSEKIELQYNTTDYANIQIKQNNKLVSNINVNHKIVGIYKVPYFVDYNNDSLNEIFFLTQTLDSIFINTLFLDNKFNFKLNETFVTKINNIEGELNDFGSLFLNTNYDLNDDKNLEVYFSISAGFPYTPRQIFAFDVKNNLIYKSPQSGVYLGITVCNNENNLLLLSTLALNNYQKSFDSIPFPDSTAWFMVLDKKLNFKFKPIEKKGYANIVINSYLNHDNSTYLISCISNYKNNVFNLIEIYNLNGEKKSEIKIENLNYEKVIWLNGNNFDDKFCTPFADIDGNIYTIEDDLKTVTKTNILKNKTDKCSFFYHYDLDNDGEMEKILVYNNGIAIVHNDLSNVCYLEIKNPEFWYATNILKNDEPTYISLFANDSFYTIYYHKNKLYYWQFVIYILIFIIIFVLLYVFQKVRTYQLEKENQKLNNTIIDRTLEIINQKEEIEIQSDNLKNLVLELKKMDKFKQNMTNMLVHDLKNPLNAILNFTENPNIKNSANQMNVLINNMLDVQRFEESKLILKFERHNLNKIIIEAFKQVEFLIVRKNLIFENKISDNINVKCDKNILERVFINLLNNAAKFTPVNGLITIYYDKNIENILKIYVKDSGIGIKEQFLNKIFDEFECDENSETNNITSTGLGLTFCKLAINASNQEIGVESKMGEGTCFWFTILEDDGLNLNNNQINNNELIINKFKFSNQEIEILKPFIENLKTIEIYEISKLNQQLKMLDKLENQNIINWKNDLEYAIYNLNEELFKDLLKILN